MKKFAMFFAVVAFLGVLAAAVLLFTTRNHEAPLEYSSIGSQPTHAIVEELKQPEPPKTTAKILIFGDTAVLEPLAIRVEKDPLYNPFSKVKEFFAQFDYVVGNQEATIDGLSVGTRNAGKPYTFSTPKVCPQLYKNVGIDVMAYSNNHTKDYGPKSVVHTIELLKAEGIATFGSGANISEAYKPHYVTVNGNTIAMLGFNAAEYAYNRATENEAGTASFLEDRVRTELSEAKKNADVVIIFAHWGREHTQVLDAESQVKWAKIFTNAGADVVIGSHPHVVQKIEKVNGKTVFYSIGNFMMPGQAWDPNAQKDILVELNIDSKKLVGYKVHNAKMDAAGVPEIVE